MTDKNKERLRLALLNASEFIKKHVETGLEPEDINENDEEGLESYRCACHRASSLIETLAKKYQKS